MTSEEISKEIFYKPATNGRSKESIEEGAELIDRYVKEQLRLYGVVVPEGTLPYLYKHQLKSIDQLNQTQASLSQQLQILRSFANKLGLYDASDYLKEK